MADAPFATLMELARRSQSAGRGLPASTESQTHWTGLGFSLLGQRFVVPMNEVTEIMRVPQCTRLPGVKPFVVGIANVRGKLMSIIDVATFFGEISGVPRSQRRALVVEDEEHYFGFMIDESLGMQHFPADSWTADTVDVNEKFRPYIRGSYTIANTVWPVMSLDTLTADGQLDKLG